MAVRSGHRRFIIIIITTAPFEVEGREVGCSTVYEVYMVRFMMSIWYRKTRAMELPKDILSQIC